jgi:hypothetical protein
LCLARRTVHHDFSSLGGFGFFVIRQRPRNAGETNHDSFFLFLDRLIYFVVFGLYLRRISVFFIAYLSFLLYYYLRN